MCWRYSGPPVPYEWAGELFSLEALCSNNFMTVKFFPGWLQIEEWFSLITYEFIDCGIGMWYFCLVIVNEKSFCFDHKLQMITQCGIWLLREIFTLSKGVNMHKYSVEVKNWFIDWWNLWPNKYSVFCIFKCHKI